MHETGLVSDLIRQLEHIAADNEPASITTIRVRVGALTQISEQHFSEHFNRAVIDHPLGNANLEVNCSEDTSAADAQAIILESVELETL